jgi:hypothetical protein
MNKTIKASSITGAGVFTIMFIVLLFNQAGDNPIGYCNSTQEFCIAVDGFSSGSQTRCYNKTDMNWWEAPYCKEGWNIVTNDLEIPKTINETKEELPKPIINKGVWGKTYKCNQTGCYSE